MSPVELALLVLLIVNTWVIVYFLAMRRTRVSTPEPQPQPEVAAEKEEPALPFNPSNPPRSLRYVGKGGLFCHCHDREIAYGEEVLHWPVPTDEGEGIYVICSTTIQEGKRAV